MWAVAGDRTGATTRAGATRVSDDGVNTVPKRGVFYMQQYCQILKNSAV